MLEQYPIREIAADGVFSPLQQIPKPPGKLFIRGTPPDQNSILLTVVGSRKATSYGKEATEKLIAGLKGFNVVIVSGMAFGIDSIAHEAAIKAGLKTIAVPGSGLKEEVLYPKTHINLAKRILDAGGCLLSEFPPDTKAAQWTFPQRNRIMAGLGHATLVIEAEKPSGTLITSKLATDYNRDVLAVPGSIFSKSSEGPHMLIKLGATPIENSEDILVALGIEVPKEAAQKDLSNLSSDELAIVKLLNEPLSRDDLADAVSWDISKISEVLTLLEIKGVIKEVYGKIVLT